MPKIRDLAINTIPSKRPAGAGHEADGYRMGPNDVRPPGEPAPPQCKPNSPPPTPPKNAGLPDEAVALMKQQLQQQVKSHIHS